MARKFRFRLETIERLRRDAREARRRTVAERQRAVLETEAQLAAVAERVRSSESQRRVVLTGRPASPQIDVDLLRRQQMYRDSLQADRTRRNEELTKKRNELQAARAELAEASKQLKVIEKLRARRWDQHLSESRREEQAITDEAALVRYLSRYGREPHEVGEDGP